MAVTVDRSTSGREYKVKDISLADQGRLEISLAEGEMAGLMALRTELGASQPLKGARITGLLDLTIQTAVLIETLTALGAEVRWLSRYFTHDHAAAAVARDSAAVFAVDDYWWCKERAFDWGPDGGPDLIVDFLGVAGMLIQYGVRVEDEFEMFGKIPNPTSTEVPCVNSGHYLYSMIKDGLEVDPKKYNNMKEMLVGVSEETDTGVKKWYQMHKGISPVFNINESVTKSMFDKFYGSRYSLSNGLIRATDVMISGKVGVVCGYGDVGKGCAASLKQGGARVIVTEIDPIRALQALMEGFQVVPLEDVVSIADIFVTATGDEDIITVDHMRKMKNNAIVCSMGDFDYQIDMNGLKSFPGVEVITIKPLITYKYVFPDTKSAIIVVTEGIHINHNIHPGFVVTTHPSFVVSCSLTNHAIAQLELWKERSTAKYEKKVYVLPKHLDQKVASLHLAKLGAKLTTKHSKEQAEVDYIHVPEPVEAP